MSSDASPLLPYANAWLVIKAGDASTPEMDGSRIVYGSSGDNAGYIFRAYLKLDDARTNYLINTPLANNSTSDSRYTGYILQYTRVNDITLSLPGSGFNNINSPLSLGVIDAGADGRVIFSKQPPDVNDTGWQHAFIEICNGKFRSVGIDETIYESIGGIPITLTVGDFSNTKMLNL